MKKKLLSFVSLFFFATLYAQVSVTNLLCENETNPLGMDITQPRFSWQLVSDQRNVSQSAYEIRVANTPYNLKRNKQLIWNSGKVASGQSIFIPYNGSALQSAKKYYWQVRIWDSKGKPTAWSAPASFEMGLLQPTDWKAQWIGVGYTEDTVLRPSPMFRKTFAASKKIQSARAYVTSHGMYEAYINGQRVGDAYLSPCWTSYNKRLPYQVYDVTPLLNKGDNAIGVTLGNGWYRGYIGFNGNKNFYGKDVALLLQLQITYDDGSTDMVTSDGTWKSSTGPIQSSEIYNGELYDARKEKKGWSTASYNDQSWSGVRVKEYPKDILVATYNEPIRKHETFHPVKIFTTPKGEQVIDFGQNLVGWVQVKAKGKSGDKIVISHAEVLDKEGNFYTENLRSAKEQNTYILNGSGEETFEPHFTFQGFRYIKVEGYPGALQPENFTAVALYSDTKPTGTFTSSDSLLNQLQHNIQWGQRGNFLDVPTDCPQRDERLGWTGDAQVFSRTAMFNRDVHNFFTKWLKDVAADQLPNGSVPFVIPNVLGDNSSGSTGWADVATIIPWNMYLAYGDKRILEQQYPSMKAWVDFMQANSTNNLWNKGFHFGDWLFYRPFDDNDGRSAITDKYLIAQCFYAHSTQLLINAAKLLGKTEEANQYEQLLHNIKAAFLKEYVTPNGRLVSGTQTAYVLALNFDMLPQNLRPQAAERLVENIKSYGNHLTTGFLGTPYLCHVLTRFGYNDVAYTLLMQQSYPSWLYPVKMGATTIWERWNGIRTDGTFEPASMNSFNHYAYGAIGDWMYRVAAGLDTYESDPGYKKIKVMPHIGGGLTSVAAQLQTPYGTAASQWKTDSSKLWMDVTIPANTTAVVYIPAKNIESILEGNKPLSALNDAHILAADNNYIPVEVGSGTYHFVVNK